MRLFKFPAPALLCAYCDFGLTVAFIISYVVMGKLYLTVRVELECVRRKRNFRHFYGSSAVHIRVSIPSVASAKQQRVDVSVSIYVGHYYN